MANPIHAPWRIEYIRTIDKGDGTCFLCDAAKPSDADQARKRLILWTTEHCTVLINRYPYTNGHLLIAPKSHKADMADLSDAELFDLQKQTVLAIDLLKRSMSPQGFNVGINLGRCAGAGIPGHLHQHVVPRWGGDTNFMSVLGQVRIIPQALEQLYEELMKNRVDL